jgi:hypothetical protein
MVIHPRLVVLVISVLLCAGGCASCGDDANEVPDGGAAAGGVGGSAGGPTAGAGGGATGPSYWPTCGNGVVDSGEKCDPLDGCPHECPQTDSCQVPHLEGSPWTCNAECVSAPVTACASGDGCCPTGCTLANDGDCFTYYVDPTGGDDANDGQSPATAWQSMAKVNATALLPGESVGFKRGGLWREPLVISSSGEAGDPVRFGAYGSGEKPVINPTVEVTGWQLDSGSVWVADLAAPVRQLYFDGEFVPVAHDPNGGYHIIDLSSGVGTSLVDDELAPGGDLVGATVCIRSVPWEIEERSVVAFDPGTHTLSFDTAATYGMEANAGYYLENQRWMLDSENEWFFDAAAGKLYLWAPDGVDPSGHVVEVSPLDTDVFGAVPGQDGVSGRDQHHVAVSDLAVRQAARYGVYLRDMGQVQLSRLDVRRVGGGGAPDPDEAFGKGIYVVYAPSVADDPSIVSDCVVADTVREGIDVVGSDYLQILRNTVLRTGVIGMPRHAGAAMAVSTSSINPSDHMLIEGNWVDRTGNTGITYEVSNATLRHNLVNHACLVLNDCGSIYSWDGIETDLGLTGNVLDHNVTMNAFGNTDGSQRTDKGANGFYFDNRSHGDTATGNTALANASLGLYFSNPFLNTATGNTLYGNGEVQLDLGEHGWEGMSDFGPGYVHDNAVSDNLFFSTSAQQLDLQVASDFADPHVADFAGNLYAQPYNPLSIVVQRIDPWSQHFFSLEGWQAMTSNDLTGRTLAGAYLVSPFGVGTMGATELVTNGTFDADINGWTVYPAGIPQTWVADCGLDGGCYEVVKNQAGLTQALGYSPPMDLVAGTTYLLRFSIRASSFEQVEVGVMRHVDPWDDFFTARVAVSPARADYEMIVTLAESTQMRVRFACGPSDGVTYDIDDVSIREASDIVTNDPTDDSRIVFNAAATDQAIDLGDGAYCDVDGQTVQGSLTLGPFESKILLACFCNHDGTCNNQETAATCAADCGG